MNAGFRLPRGPGAYLCASLVLLAVARSLEGVLTHTMARHMLLHIPLVLCAGIFAGAALCTGRHRRGARWRRVREMYGKYNELGVPGLLLGTFVAAYWMIPKSLDDVLLFPMANAGKYAGLFLAGMVLFDALRRANNVIKLFFLGNFSWMMAIVGLVYQEETSRLCNVYLLGDQEIAGRGLVVLAVAVPVAWLWSARSRARRLLAK
ncbi:hypothetical protein RE432_00055 [Pusillimonas sp. SM2304]|uniref:hypothetical protein n=1 Tax=Pusillimonas sp. SM2304 TaxID=3073241 RepID=UPI002874B208|nr:hypothetical protein [Pusillimonas sp. SM2304]MDS1138807.1 hypothetical protein [Pusillimonas sp. SM2304]